jgi:hypothetical protein
MGFASSLTTQVLDSEAPCVIEVSFLLPHEMMHHLWMQGFETFSNTMFGPNGPDALQEWWDAALEDPAYKNHPALRNRAGLKTLVPIMIYTDGAEVFSNHEYYFWCWSSPLSRGQAVDTKMPIAAISAAYLSLPHIKVEALGLVTKVIAWSLQVCETGKWPTVGYYGEPLGDNTLRGKLSGQQLAGGWRGDGSNALSRLLLLLLCQLHRRHVPV